MSIPTGVSIKGDRHVSMGASGIFTWTKDGTVHTAFVIQSGSKTTDGEETTVAGSSGNTSSHILFDDRTECEVEITWRNNETYPERQNIVTICGIAAIVTKVANKWQNKNVRGCTITAKAYADLTYVTDSSDDSANSASS
jgi:hypothetical protein